MIRSTVVTSFDRAVLIAMASEAMEVPHKAIIGGEAMLLPVCILAMLRRRRLCIVRIALRSCSNNAVKRGAEPELVHKAAGCCRVRRGVQSTKRGAFFVEAPQQQRSGAAS
jgi:hypothetical protein